MKTLEAIPGTLPERRFEFGKNWSRFLAVLTDDRILEAQKSLRTMLEVEDLRGRRFLDIGSGSGLFGLAARRLGARVRSFDVDPQSVACTAELKRRYFPDDPDWIVERGSVLDLDYMRALGEHDVVYSWGVLHHTGAMWQALENVTVPMASRGLLFISIYNDQGLLSRFWRQIKRTYNALPSALRVPFVVGVMLPRELLGFLVALAARKPGSYVQSRIGYCQRNRGMNLWHDLVDWVGGYPFEVAKPEQVFDLYRRRGFVLRKLKTCAGGLGCNEFVFEKHGAGCARIDA